MDRSHFESKLEASIARIPSYICNLQSVSARLTDSSFIAHTLVHHCLSENVTLKRHFEIYTKTDIYMDTLREFLQCELFRRLQPEVLRCSVYLHLQQKRLLREYPLLVTNSAVRLLLDTVHQLLT